MIEQSVLRKINILREGGIAMSAQKKLLFSDSKDAGLLLFRVLLGGFIAYHGYKKFVGGKDTLTYVGSMLSQFGITKGHMALGVMAALSELIGGIFVAFGFLNRIATAMVAGTLAVATSVMYKEGFSKFSYPLEMMLTFVSLLVAGPGKFSVDYIIKKNWIKK